MGKLALFLLALPAAELFVLVRLAHAIGGWPTFLLVLGSAILGALVARAAGLRVIAQMRQAVSTGAMPSYNVLNGVLILCASALLIIPGVVSDVLALLLLIPWSRRLIAARLVSSVSRAVEEGKLHVVDVADVVAQARVAQARVAQPWPGAPQSGASMVIDTEGETVEAAVVEHEAPKPPRLSS